MSVMLVAERMRRAADTVPPGTSASDAGRFSTLCVGDGQTIPGIVER